MMLHGNFMACAHKSCMHTSRSHAQLWQRGITHLLGVKTTGVTQCNKTDMSQLRYSYISVGPLTGVLNSPVQLWLSVLSIKPSWQVQKYDPGVLVQLWLHPLVLLVHSSISASSQKMHGLYCKWRVCMGVLMYVAIIIIVYSTFFTICPCPS